MNVPNGAWPRRTMTTRWRPVRQQAPGPGASCPRGVSQRRWSTWGRARALSRCWLAPGVPPGPGLRAGDETGTEPPGSTVVGQGRQGEGGCLTARRPTAGGGRPASGGPRHAGAGMPCPPAAASPPAEAAATPWVSGSLASSQAPHARSAPSGAAGPRRGPLPRGAWASAVPGGHRGVVPPRLILGSAQHSRRPSRTRSCLPWPPRPHERARACAKPGSPCQGLPDSRAEVELRGCLKRLPWVNNFG